MIRPADPAAPERLSILKAEPWEAYALLDSGDGRKLERYGRVTVVRPEPQAMWRPAAPDAFAAADAVFSGEDDEDGPGRWRIRAGAQVPETWPVTVGPVTMSCRLTRFRHLGLFPEQRPHWAFMADRVRARAGGEPPEILNLFGYTGAASLLLAEAGARVTHVDASRKAIAWARDNQVASGLEDRPIRWICEDARKFVAREVRRGRRYDGILLDPPKFGRGPRNETFNLLEDLAGILADCRRLLAADSLFLVLTVYAIRLSALSCERLLAEACGDLPGRVDGGELAIVEGASGRLLPTSLFARWSAP